MAKPPAGEGRIATPSLSEPPELQPRPTREAQTFKNRQVALHRLVTIANRRVPPASNIFETTLVTGPSNRRTLVENGTMWSLRAAINRAVRVSVVLPAFALLVGATVATAAQAPVPEPAYVVRGRQTEIRQRELKDRLDHFHDSLSDHLRRDAPNLLSKLEVPPPLAYGYQIVPNIVPNPPSGPPVKPHVVSFSWPLAEALISREMGSLDRLELELDLASASQRPADARHPAYEAIVADYKKALDGRRVIDANIAYNWLWQRQIGNDRPLFDRLNAHLNAEADKLARSPAPSPQPEAPMIDIDLPAFVRVDPPAGQLRIVTVRVYTDILDARAVNAFRRAIETHWQVHNGRNEYRVRLTIKTISPEQLYCGPRATAAKGNGKVPAAACAPPAKGDHIDLTAHVARFPTDGAVLTTGAESLQIVGPRSIVLGPHDEALRTLAHEFGHILGFPDAYLRGYKDVGSDGFEVLELVPDYGDIMSSPGDGSVLARHFTAVFMSKEIQTLMSAGLDALYKRSDPANAAAQFRQVLARNPDHYGATLQLAKALDQAGRPDEALPLWRRMLGMAGDAGDAETLQTVRMRLADVQ